MRVRGDRGDWHTCLADGLPIVIRGIRIRQMQMRMQIAQAAEACGQKDVDKAFNSNSLIKLDFVKL